jgi:hypothetical protein
VPIDVVTGMLGPIRHEDLGFRLEAIYTLGILGQIDGTAPARGYRAVAEALAERLGDPSPAARIAVARVSGRVFRRCVAPCDLPGLERLGDALVHTLNDPEREVRLAALEAIGVLRWARALQALTAAYEYYQKGPDALSNLAALARIAHPSSSTVFRTALSRKEEAFRLAGAEGLARIGGTDAAFAAQALANAQSRDLLVAESFASVRSGDVKALDRLVKAVDAGPSRSLARDYLIELGAASARPVAEALGSAGPDTRVALIEALSVIGGAGELAAVEALRNDKDQKVAAAAERAALRIAARSGR